MTMTVVVAQVAVQVTSVTPAAALPATVTDVNPDVSTSPDADATTGGRVNHITNVAGNNQTYYAASEQGGLFKTTNGGSNWTHLDGHVPEVTWDVKANPGATSTVYATSFYDGKVSSTSGIEVSTDSGATWSHPASATPGASAHCSAVPKAEPAALGIGIRPDATSNVFVGTNCGVARSTDSGATWTFIDPTPATTNASKVWAVLPMSGGTIEACGDDGFFRSTDNGDTWTPATTPPPAGICSLAVSPDESYVMFATASNNHAWESDDSGATWTDIGKFGDPGQGRIPFVSTNNRTAGFDLWFGDVTLWRVACTTPATPAPGGTTRCGVGGTVNGPFTRSVGGHDDLGSVAFDSAAANDACPRLFSSDGGAHVNQTGGNPACQNPTWNRANVGLHALWVFGMSGTDLAGAGNEGLFFGVQDDGFHATTTAGNNPPTWSNPQCCDGFDVVSDANRTVNTICCFTPAPATRLFLGNAAGTVQNFVPNQPPGSIVGFTSTSSLVEFGDKQYGVLTTSGLFLTTDITLNPITWTQLGSATSPAGACGVSLAISGGTPTFFLQAGSCTGSSGDQIWRFTGTGAGSWTRIDNNNGVTGGFGIFAVDGGDPNRIYASNLAPAGPRMIRSNDGGSTYTPDTALDAMMTGNGAFYYRNSSGPTNFTGTSGYVQPTLVAFDPSDSSTLVAGGHDSGVFVSRNNGVTWSLATDPYTPGVSGRAHLSQPRFAYFDHDGAGLLGVYIGTQGRGVWRIVPPAAPACTSTQTGDITGPLTVTAGNSLCIVNARVYGPITVQSGGALTVANSKLYRGVSSTGSTFTQICGSQLSPPATPATPTLEVTGSTGSITVGDTTAGCGTNQVAGTTNLSTNGSDVTFGNNQTSDNVTVNGNTGSPIVIKGNTLFKGALGCAGNTVAPTNAGQTNTAAGGKTGQCAAL